jgi:hypothetical protein
MTFEEMLDQAIDILQRRRRLTYRALQLQLNLDDEYFDVIKDELIDGQQLAVIRKYFIFVQLVLANLSTLARDVKGLHAPAREFSKLFKHCV